MQRRLLYMTGGALLLAFIVIGVGAFLFIPKLTSANTIETSSALTPTMTATTTTHKQDGTAKVLRQYAADIKKQIAQGLNMSSDQLTIQLQAGKTLTQVAIAQKLSSTQFQTVISNAFQTSLKFAVANGTLTQKQLDDLTKKYQEKPDGLDRLLSGKKAQTMRTPTIATPEP